MAQFRKAIIGLALTAAVSAAAIAQSSGAPVAQVSSGRISGVTANGVTAFLGIPYAAPPVGARRWAPSAAPASWTGTRAMNASGENCPQVLNPVEGRLPWTPEYLIARHMSEDCLFLNVWRPADMRQTNLPVLFWIHGGGGVEGSNSVPVYDGAALARRGIIVVSVNYRLGVLASFSHPELSKEQGGASGNYAIQDILAALRWTNANAAAFGGDAKRITIAGQSAGSGYVSQLMGSPAAKGLFSRAITESGSQWGTRPAPIAPAVADERGAKFATSIGAPTLAQLRAAPAEQLVQKATDYANSGQGRFGTVIDGRNVTGDANSGQAKPGFNDTPILSGFNADEEAGSDDKYGSWTAAELAKKRDGFYGPLAADAARLYPAATDAEARTGGITMSRDRTRTLEYEWAKRRAAVSANPIYMYFFSHPHPGPMVARYGTFHSSEIPYVFGNLNAPRPFTAADRAVSDRMMSRWVAFIKGGSPNAPGLPEWPRFDAAKPAVMLLGDEEKVVPVMDPERLALADKWADLHASSPVR